MRRPSKTQGGTVPAAVPNKSFLPSIPSDGIESGGYRVHQSIEPGHRVSDTTGSDAMYDTLVNLHGGPRVLEQSLYMQSIEHEGVLIDNFFVRGFGWGEDANNGLRVRLDKSTGSIFAAISDATKIASTTTCWAIH